MAWIPEEFWRLSGVKRMTYAERYLAGRLLDTADKWGRVPIYPEALIDFADRSDASDADVDDFISQCINSRRPFLLPYHGGRWAQIVGFDDIHRPRFLLDRGPPNGPKPPLDVWRRSRCNRRYRDNRKGEILEGHPGWYPEAADTEFTQMCADEPQECAEVQDGANKCHRATNAQSGDDQHTKRVQKSANPTTVAPKNVRTPESAPKSVQKGATDDYARAGNSTQLNPTQPKNQNARMSARARIDTPATDPPSGAGDHPPEASEPATKPPPHPDWPQIRDTFLDEYQRRTNAQPTTSGRYNHGLFGEEGILEVRHYLDKLATRYARYLVVGIPEFWETWDQGQEINKARIKRLYPPKLVDELETYLMAIGLPTPIQRQAQGGYA